MNTVGDALKEIDAALDNTAPCNFTAKSTLHLLRKTVREAVGLAKNPKREEKIDQAIMEQRLPTHIRQLILARLMEVGYKQVTRNE